MSERKLENPSDQSVGSVDVSELIAARAHEIFQNRGGEHGHDLDDWLQAEQDVRASLSSESLTSATGDQQLAAKAGATSLSTSEVQASEPSARSGKKR
jgi:uncharacterized protein YidB (DUF937 family)